MKKLCVFLVLALLLAAGAHAENKPIVFTYSNGGKAEASLPFGTPLSDIPADLADDFSESRLPYWNQENGYTPDAAGYAADGISWLSLKFKNRSIENLTVFCAYDYDADGGHGAMADAPLYRVEFELQTFLSLSKAEFNAFIQDLTAAYGKPVTTETASGSGILITGGGIYNTKSYKHAYLWRGGDKTALRVTATYTTPRNEYSDIRVCMGKTNYDAILKAGRLLEEPPAVEAATRLDAVLMKDGNGKLVEYMGRGVRLLITGYDAGLDQFYAQIVGKNKEGYITGKGLTVSREELLENFQ